MYAEMRSIAAVLATAALVSCARGEQAGAATADSTARNLTLASPESTAVGGDVAPAPAAELPAAAPAPRPAARPPAPRPAATRPAAPTSFTLGTGTRLHMGVTDTITSRTAKAGDSFTATVVEDITDASGRVMVPAGSAVRGTIAEVKAAPDPYTPGTLRLSLSTLTVRGETYSIHATIDSLETVRQGRGVTAGDAGKVAAGAAAGAVLGRIVGGNKTGTIIGGVVGAAAGAGVAHNTKDSDVVLPAGAHILARLDQAVTIAAR